MSAINMSGILVFFGQSIYSSLFLLNVSKYGFMLKMKYGVAEIACFGVKQT